MKNTQIKEGDYKTFICPCCEKGGGLCPAYFVHKDSDSYWCGYCKHTRLLDGSIKK